MKPLLFLVLGLMLVHSIDHAVGIRLSQHYPFWKVVLHNNLFLAVGILYGMIVGWKESKKDQEKK